MLLKYSDARLELIGHISCENQRDTLATQNYAGSDLMINSAGFLLKQIDKAKEIEEWDSVDTISPS